MNANQLKKLLKFHRGFGMVLGILVLMWSLTGVWTAPSILDMRPPHFEAVSNASGLIPSRCE